MPLLSLATLFGKSRTVARISAVSCLALSLAAVELAQGHAKDLADEYMVPIYTAVRTAPEPLQVGDVDADGLSDTREAELAREYAPIVLLEKEDRALPASVPWVLERTHFMESAANVRRVHRAFDAETRKGSENRADWVTYVNVHPRVDGGMHIEYWFYYPYNDGPLFFQHESDWEHITVRLDEQMKPLGAYLARHENNAPGPYFTWSKLRKEGSHPIVFSARGTHATYANAADAPWFEYIASCTSLDECAAQVWRTWEGGGLSRLDDLPADSMPSSAFRYSGRWGAEGFLPGTSAPRGPLFQAGHCTGGFATCSLASASVTSGDQRSK